MQDGNVDAYAKNNHLQKLLFDSVARQYRAVLATPDHGVDTENHAHAGIFALEFQVSYLVP
jgi:hypothetical protein